MAIDRRELLLERLVTIAGALPSINLAGRNFIDPPDTLLPAAMVFEGEEDIREDDAAFGRPTGTPTRVSMRPYIVITAMTKPNVLTRLEDGTAIWNDALGSMLNSIRVALVKAIVNDATLPTIYGGNGRIIYTGMQSEFKEGKSLIGKMALTFHVTYVLAPFEL